MLLMSGDTRKKKAEEANEVDPMIKPQHNTDAPDLGLPNNSYFVTRSILYLSIVFIVCGFGYVYKDQVYNYLAGRRIEQVNPVFNETRCPYIKDQECNYFVFNESNSLTFHWNQKQRGRFGNHLSRYFAAQSAAHAQGKSFISPRTSCGNKYEEICQRLPSMVLNAGASENQRDIPWEKILFHDWPHEIKFHLLTWLNVDAVTISLSTLFQNSGINGDEIKNILAEKHVVIHVRCQENEALTQQQSTMGPHVFSAYQNHIPKSTQTIWFLQNNPGPKCKDIQSHRERFIKEKFPNVEFKYTKMNVLEDFAYLYYSEISFCSASTYCIWATVGGLPYKTNAIHVEGYVQENDVIKMKLENKITVIPAVETYPKDEIEKNPRGYLGYITEHRRPESEL